MKVLALDFETTGSDFWHGCRPFIASTFDGKKGTIYTGEVDGPTRNVTWDFDTLQQLQNQLDEADEIVFHNTNFDMRAAESIGIDIKRIWKKFQDTLAASHLLCSSDVHGLKELAIKYLRYTNNDESELQAAVVAARELNPSWKAKKGHPHFPATKNAKFWKMDLWLEPELCKKYAGHDAIRTWLLWGVFKKGLLQDKSWPMYEMRRDLLPVLYRMQSVGINFNLANAKELYNHLTEQREQLRQFIQVKSNAEVDIDPSKPDDLRLLLYNILNIKPTKFTKEGKPSTKADTLDKLLEENDSEVIQYVKAWRKVDKQRTSVISYSKWQHNGRIHSWVNLTGTHWTRQTSNDPNQQNFDKSMNALWQPPQGYYWLDVDIVNIELRIFAYEVGSKQLIEAFERNESVHMIIAKALYPEMLAELGEAAFKKTKTYTNCKSGTFSKLYGGGKHKVDSTYGIANAVAVIEEKIPEVGKYFKQLDAIMRANRDIYGYPTIFTRQGYRLEVPISKPHTIASGRIQGTAAIIIQDMMLQLSRDPYYEVVGAEMIQQVHDSLRTEIPDHPYEDFTNNYIVKKLEEVGRKHIPTCPLEFEVVRASDEPQKLPDYKNINNKIGDYRVEIYKQFCKERNMYRWHVQLNHKEDRSKKAHFEAQWRNQALDLATQFIESQ